MWIPTGAFSWTDSGACSFRRGYATSSRRSRGAARLGPYALLDARFPMTYKTSVPEGVKVMTAYFAALSERDLKGMAETLHFPFASYEGTDPVSENTF